LAPFIVSLLVLDQLLPPAVLPALAGALATLTPHQVVAALVLVVASRAMAIPLDALALRQVGVPQPASLVLLASLIGTAYASNLGAGLCPGDAPRARVLAGAGLSALETTMVTRLVAFSGDFGALVVAGFALIVTPEVLAPLFSPLSAPWRIFGLPAALAFIGFALWTTLRGDPVRVLGAPVPTPDTRLTLLQIAFATLQMLLEASVLAALLPSGAPVPAIMLMGAFALAAGVSRLSGVPGGLGVFEAVILMLLPQIPAPEALTALLTFRLITNVLPLLVAALWLAYRELGRGRRRKPDQLVSSDPSSSRLLPVVAAALVFVAGALLLLRGALPVMGENLNAVRLLLPLPGLELAQLTAAIAGLAMLAIAPGLVHRLANAWLAAATLLVLGIISSLLRGLDYPSALFLASVLLVLLPVRASFMRVGGLPVQLLAPDTLAAGAIVLLLTVWIGGLSIDLQRVCDPVFWRQVAYEANGPRILRTTAVVGALALLLAALRFSARQSPPPRRPTAPEVSRAARIVRRSRRVRANAALMGDKAFLFAESGDAFIMYAVRGRIWVALGDPVGNVEHRPELAWRFLERCDRSGGEPVFYQVGALSRPLYTDLGLAFIHLGDEASLPLARLAPETLGRPELRSEHKRAFRAGARFQLIGPDRVRSVIDVLEAVSAAWLGARRMHDRGFAVGRFAAECVSQFPCAVVRLDGRIVAFATVWTAAEHAEIAVDLIRYRPEAPRGVLDFLFVELMVWAHEQGYDQFQLGVVPPPEGGQRPLAAADLLYDLPYAHGEHFCGLARLRQFKERFQPSWQPSFLAYRASAGLSPALDAVTELIAGRKRRLQQR
jgi:phosphatidylglycerol lysyltransferase